MTTPVHSRLLTVAQTADRLQVSQRTVRRRIEGGQLPAVRLGEGRAAVRIDECELDAWLYQDDEGDAA